MRWQDARATVAIAALTLVASALVLFSGMLSEVAVRGGFIAARVAGAALPAGFGGVVPVWLTPLTATLIHGGIAHLVLNLVMLVYCGQQAERAIGAAGMVLLYVIGAYAGAACQWAFGPVATAPMIGASGAISAVVAAYALLYGERRARRIGPLSDGIVHALWLATAWIGIQLLIGFAGMGGTSVAIGAHIGGFIVGLAMARPLLAWRYRTA